VAVEHGTTGIAPGCGVSIAPFTPGSVGFGTWDRIVSGLVGAGFAVVATDYANLATPGVPNYLTMRGEGADVLNAIRAAFELDRDGLDRGNVGLLGHSQGGHAALSAAYIAPEYAPELSIKGTVALAPAIFPPAPLLKTFITSGMDKKASGFLSFTADIVNSWAANYPGKISLEDVYTPEGVKAAELALTKCQDTLYEAFDAGPKKDFVKPDLPDSVVELAGENFPIYQRYAQPLLIQQGLEDATVVPSVNIAAARTFCELGSQVNLQTYPGDVHSSLLYTGEAQAIDWLRERFADLPVDSDCEAL
jgi:pimeloyl-ACP methyl ester carboxylesterase